MRDSNTFIWVLTVSLVALLMLSNTSTAVVWENFTEADGLIDNCASSVHEAADGSIWIGTCGVGLNQYIDGELLTWDQGTSWLPDDILGICEDAQGAIWCLSYNEGCGFLEAGIWQEGFTLDWDIVPGLQWAAGGISCGPDGRLWAGFAEGIKWYDPETGQGQKVWTSPRYDYADFGGIPHFLCVTSAGRIWFCSRELDGQMNLYEMDDTGTILSAFPGLWGTVAEAPDGTIWYGDKHDFGNLGIMMLEGDEFVHVGPPDGYPASTIGPIFISEGGQLVCGGFDRDSRAVISVFDQYRWEPYVCPFKGWDGATNIIMDKKGDIWLAHGNPGWGSGCGTGVWVLRRETESLSILLGIDADVIRGTDSTSQRVLFDLISSQRETVDLYVALESPNGAMYFYPGFGVAYTPFLKGINIPAETHIENYELFTISLPELPSGTYRWYSAFTHAGTMDFASNIASCEWQVE